jgi:hypothetical protein
VVNDEWIVQIDSAKCGYPYVDLLHHESPLLYPYPDHKLRREVKVWLRDNVGTRAIRWEEFTTNEDRAWIALQGYDENLTSWEEMRQGAMENMEWRHAHLRLYFYFKDANMALLFKLTWGGH